MLTNNPVHKRESKIAEASYLLLLAHLVQPKKELCKSSVPYVKLLLPAPGGDKCLLCHKEKLVELCFGQTVQR